MAMRKKSPARAGVDSRGDGRAIQLEWMTIRLRRRVSMERGSRGLKHLKCDGDLQYCDQMSTAMGTMNQGMDEVHGPLIMFLGANSRRCSARRYGARVRLINHREGVMQVTRRCQDRVGQRGQQ